MKKLLIFLSAALLGCFVFVSCEDDGIPVAYITVADGSSFTPDEIPAAGGSVTFAFQTNYTWKISGYTKMDWCTFDALAGDSGYGTLTVTAGENTDEAVRTGTFSILAGAAVQEVTITQTETNQLIVTESSFDVAAEGGNVEVPVSANIDFTVTVPSDIDWISYVSTKTINDYTVTLSVDATNQVSVRSGTVTISGGDFVEYVTITQEGSVTQTWSLNFSENLTSISSGVPFRLGISGENLLMSNSSTVYSVNAATGAYVSDSFYSGAIAPQSFVSDDAGNILVAATATCTSSSSDYFIIYEYDGTNITDIASYPVSTFYTGKIGNVRVRGDIKGDAVITAFVSTCTYYIAWQVTGGVVGTPVIGQIPFSNTYGVGDIYYGCVAPVSDDLTDGLIFIGYAGTYTLKYCADPVSAKEWTVVWDPGTSGNENYCCISTVEQGSKRYCAIGQGGHFSWSAAPTVYLLDITDMSAVETLYSNQFSGTFANVGGDDVKLVSDSTEGLILYYVDRGYDFVTRISFGKL